MLRNIPVKGSTLSVLLLSMLALPALAQSGRVIESVTVHSDILGQNMRYAVYLPPD